MKTQILNFGKTLKKEELKNINGGTSRLQFCEEVCSRNRYYPDHYYVRCGCA
ncbi:hypothetical protein [Tenacibaculum agarivorans]|uniref:hypothetical protein n=1 Tax=Tenacibaculum agarivorans TaxID=1908389 RepID=UPI000AF585B4|nr:hypothetical protein [Tenacibaculum agarivorans]